MVGLLDLCCYLLYRTISSPLVPYHLSISLSTHRFACIWFSSFWSSIQLSMYHPLTCCCSSTISLLHRKGGGGRKGSNALPHGAGPILILYTHYIHIFNYNVSSVIPILLFLWLVLDYPNRRGVGTVSHGGCWICCPDYFHSDSDLTSIRWISAQRLLSGCSEVCSWTSCALVVVRYAPLQSFIIFHVITTLNTIHWTYMPFHAHSSINSRYFL